MREIKFRAWNNDEGYITQKHLDGYSIQELRRGVLIDRPTDGEQTFIELEQYTGLKDKNGREIYEGDIVRYWYDLGPAGEYEGISAVSIEKFGIAPIKKWNYTERRTNGDNWLPEVIGNIHENPELLK